ncbi:MAG: hypothetical protein GWO02_03365, partial [Gammaproteobacteria bacterium]|nr:hypothetical protein [Gammaproteobacteria bacterium]
DGTRLARDAFRRLSIAPSRQRPLDPLHQRLRVLHGHFRVRVAPLQLAQRGLSGAQIPFRTVPVQGERL